MPQENEPPEDTNLKLPEGIQCLSHQISGHVFSSETSKPKAGMLECEDETILKACQNNKRGLRELQFYEQIFGDDHSELSPLRQHVANFHGTLTLDAFSDVTFMKLEDIRKRFEKPCIMDVKMGAVTWDPEADAAKIGREKAKYPYADEIGFHLLGMWVYDKATGEYSFTKKQLLRILKPEEVGPNGLGKFVKKNSEHFHRCVVHSFLKQLRHLRNWFQSQTKFHFFSTSLLFVYEGNRTENPKDCRLCAKACALGPETSTEKTRPNERSTEENGLSGSRKICSGVIKQEPRPSCPENSTGRKENGVVKRNLKHKIKNSELYEFCVIDSAVCNDDGPDCKVRKPNKYSGVQNGLDENKMCRLEQLDDKNSQLAQECQKSFIDNGAKGSINQSQTSIVSNSCSNDYRKCVVTCQNDEVLSQDGQMCSQSYPDNNNIAGASKKSRSRYTNSPVTNGVTTHGRAESLSAACTDDVDPNINRRENAQCNAISISKPRTDPQVSDRSFADVRKPPTASGVSDRSLADVRMIDFTHVFPANGSRDENYRFALDSLISKLEALLELKRVLI